MNDAAEETTWITEETIEIMKDLLNSGKEIYFQDGDASLHKVREISNVDWAKDGKPEPCALFEQKMGYSALLGNEPNAYLTPTDGGMKRMTTDGFDFSGTPSSHWSEKGEPDPFGGDDHYKSERSKLCMGNLTDDELANGVFMYNHRTGLMSMAWLTAAKERIRWLSRALEHQIERCEINGTGRD